MPVTIHSLVSCLLDNVQNYGITLVLFEVFTDQSDPTTSSLSLKFNTLVHISDENAYQRKFHFWRRFTFALDWNTSLLEELRLFCIRLCNENLCLRWTLTGLCCTFIHWASSQVHLRYNSAQCSYQRQAWVPTHVLEGPFGIFGVPQYSVTVTIDPNCVSKHPWIETQHIRLADWY